MTDRRRKMLKTLREDGVFDVIVIGGGVNGIGAYRELALQGLRVLLVERNDFSSGCSAAPSRMIHGGLRYLENGEFDLVRESLTERDALLRNAPHMVRPLPTVIPITSYFSGLLNSAYSFLGRSGKPSSRGAVPIKLGLSLYDWVTRKRRTMPRHRFNSARTTSRRWPALTPKASMSAVYYDAWISHPERLCIEMVQDAAIASPTSMALNYAELEVKSGDYSVCCHRTGERVPVRPKTIVNATGAWLDTTVEALGGKTDVQMVSGTKGSHLIIDRPDLAEALDDHMVYFENTDGRVCIVFPYLGNVLAGSTDIRVDKATRVRCGEDELNYILDSLRLVFPEIAIVPQDVVFSYAGIRPLPKSDQDFTGRISRGHEVRRLDGPVPQFCMIGGKWTTFRAFAEQTADQVLHELGAPRRCATVATPIGGGRDYPGNPAKMISKLIERFNVTPARAVHLVDHYGTSAVKVQAFCEADRTDTPLGEGTAYSISEIRFLIQNEFVETLSDIVLRRTDLAITGAVSVSIIDNLARILAEESQLPPDVVSGQRDDLINELADYHGVSLAQLTKRSKERSEKCA